MQTSKNFAGQIEEKKVNNKRRKGIGVITPMGVGKHFGCRQYRGERSFPLENLYLTYVECLRPRSECC